MKRKNNPTVFLLCLIVLLIFIIIILSLTSLPLMTNARENAFRIEANNIVASAGVFYRDFKNDNYLFNNSNNICQSTTKVCITIDRLSSDGYYDNQKGKYKGKIEINIEDRDNPIYTLYLNKTAEFRFVGLSYTNYRDYGQINNDDWDEKYEQCSCEATI